jgi:hypothetical protein
MHWTSLGQLIVISTSGESNSQNPVLGKFFITENKNVDNGELLNI